MLRIVVIYIQDVLRRYGLQPCGLNNYPRLLPLNTIKFNSFGFFRNIPNDDNQQEFLVSIKTYYFQASNYRPQWFLGRPEQFFP